MKNKKYLSILIIFLAIVCLGVGYAAISKELQVKGSVQTADTETLLEANYNVVFNSFTEKTTNDTTNLITASATGLDTETATINVSGFSIKDQYITLTLTVLNKSNYYSSTITDCVITAPDGTAYDSKYFTITHSFASMTIGPEETTTMDITVKLNITPNTQRSVSFLFTINAEATEG